MLVSASAPPEIWMEQPRHLEQPPLQGIVVHLEASRLSETGKVIDSLRRIGDECTAAGADHVGAARGVTDCTILIGHGGDEL